MFTDQINNDLQDVTQQANIEQHETYYSELSRSRRFSSSFFTYDTRRVNVNCHEHHLIFNICLDTSIHK